MKSTGKNNEEVFTNFSSECLSSRVYPKYLMGIGRLACSYE